MLYPKSAEKKLTQEQFRHPGSEYRGAALLGHGTADWRRKSCSGSWKY